MVYTAPVRRTAEVYGAHMAQLRLIGFEPLPKRNRPDASLAEVSGGRDTPRANHRHTPCAHPTIGGVRTHGDGCGASAGAGARCDRRAHDSLSCGHSVRGGLGG